MSDEHGSGLITPVTRRELLKISGTAMVAALAGGTGAAAQETRPRIACVVTYWAAPGSHADWIINKLLDGYWWQGAHTPSRVDVVSVYIHQIDVSPLGKKVCEAKKIPIFDSVKGALTLGGKELAVDGVVLVGEHGNYHSNVKGQRYYPRWWLFSQIVSVFEESHRSVPVFNDKHLSTLWDEAKWIYDKSRALGFPLFGGSSIPFCYREPELDLELDTPIKTSVLASFGGKESYGFHGLEALQCFAERRTGGETGVAAVQCIEGPETWRWTDRHPWAGRLLDAALKSYSNLKPGNIRDTVPQPMVFLIDYRDGTRAAQYQLNGSGVGQWTYAGEIDGRPNPAVIQTWFNFRPYGQYHAANAFSHWITELMLTRKEPYPAERLLLTTGILSYLMDSNWENARHSDIGRRLETPFLDMTYRARREPLFNKGPRPPVVPYVRGFES